LSSFPYDLQQVFAAQMFIYEEFMARSSTRQALRKGANFMGMMNVLMQLRKVCAHPDLFEPRPVVTPFVLEPIEFHTSRLVPDALDPSSPFDCASEFLRRPLWIGSEGIASLGAALQHDFVCSEQLLRLQSPIPVAEGSVGLQTDDPDILSDECTTLVWQEVRKRERNDKRESRLRLDIENRRRCQSPHFRYSSRFLTFFKVGSIDLTNELTSPQSLVALCRTQQQRASDMDDVIKNFVFAVPKAGTRCPPHSLSKKSSPGGGISKMLLEPLESLLLPFEKARARLASFFPDKKLVQFDAGKLQTLAELLRKLKASGHRVLIFTQMSKMLDILEAFLNLNGHSYLRLDGSTGVERRQRLMDRFNNDPRVFTFILSTRSGGLGINLTGVRTSCPLVLTISLVQESAINLRTIVLASFCLAG
jgi:SNF2 family DNA or RNA helicase